MKSIGDMNDLTVIIPTINSGRYLDIILGFYRDQGIPVTVFVDNASVDDTLMVAERFATKVFSIANPRRNVAETMIEPSSRLCSTRWVLRMDDDELPSSAMMTFVRAALSEKRVEVCAFERHQCAVSTRGTLLRHRNVSPTEHRQWRLYQPAKVKYTHRIHTPTFKWDPESGRTANPEASMIHLDWAVHSYEERRRKVELYDEQTPNGGTRWRSYYLYEEQPSSRESFEEMALPEFDQVCRQLSLRFAQFCVKAD